MWQWKNFLMQLEAGAADDKLEYRKLVAQLSPMRIPPFNGTNTRKIRSTADVRYAAPYALSCGVHSIILYCTHGCYAPHFTMCTRC